MAGWPKPTRKFRPANQFLRYSHPSANQGKNYRTASTIGQGKGYRTQYDGIHESVDKADASGQMDPPNFYQQHSGSNRFSNIVNKQPSDWTYATMGNDNSEAENEGTSSGNFITNLKRLREQEDVESTPVQQSSHVKRYQPPQKRQLKGHTKHDSRSADGVKSKRTVTPGNLRHLAQVPTVPLVPTVTVPHSPYPLASHVISPGESSLPQTINHDADDGYSTSSSTLTYPAVDDQATYGCGGVVSDSCDASSEGSGPASRLSTPPVLPPDTAAPHTRTHSSTKKPSRFLSTVDLLYKIAAGEIEPSQVQPVPQPPRTAAVKTETTTDGAVDDRGGGGGGGKRNTSVSITTYSYSRDRKDRAVKSGGGSRWQNRSASGAGHEHGRSTSCEPKTAELSATCAAGSSRPVSTCSEVLPAAVEVTPHLTPHLTSHLTPHPTPDSSGGDYQGITIISDTLLEGRQTSLQTALPGANVVVIPDLTLADSLLTGLVGKFSATSRYVLLCAGTHSVFSSTRQRHSAQCRGGPDYCGPDLPHGYSDRVDTAVGTALDCLAAANLRPTPMLMVHIPPRWCMDREETRAWVMTARRVEHFNTLFGESRSVRLDRTVFKELKDDKVELRPNTLVDGLHPTDRIAERWVSWIRLHIDDVLSSGEA